MENIVTATPEATNTVTPGTEADSAPTGSGTPVGEVNGQSTTDTDKGFTNIDPKTLPPTLKSVYDNMLRDYTKKTMSISERVKSETAKGLEQFKAKAEMYDQVIGNEQFVKQWNEYVQKANQSVQNGQNPSDEVTAKLQELEKKFKTTESLETINAFADAKDEKGESLHPDFDKFSSIKIGTHPESGDYDLLRTAIELAPGNSTMEKLENGYKMAKAVYDNIFEEGKKAGMGRVNAKARNGSFTPSSGSGPISGTATKRPSNALEALEMARQGLQPAK